MKKYIGFTLTLFILFSCDNSMNDVVLPTEDTTVDVQNVSNYDKALDEVFSVMKDVYPSKYAVLQARRMDFAPESYTSTTLANAFPEAVKMMKSQGTLQSQGIDTLLYLINFGNNEGYAIVAADERLDGIVYAITDNGSISTDDFNQDDDSSPQRAPSYSSMYPTSMPMSPRWITTQLIHKDVYDRLRDPLPITSVFYYHKHGPWVKTSDKIGPLVKVKYDQGTPYNNNCPTIDGKKPYAGCVAIALIQIMSANEYPSTIGGISGDWGEINSTPWYNISNTVLPQWIATIGDQCKMNYGLDESTAYASNAARCLEKYSRYKNVVIRNTVTYDNIQGMLRDGLPLFCRANCSGKDIGHAWVLDGLLKQRRESKFYQNNVLLSTTYNYRHLVHCNFGWDGLCDGYYLTDIFDLPAGPIETEPDDKAKITNDNYSIDTQIIKYTLN